MRNYPSLYEMLRKETTNPNPRQAAEALTGQAPEGATDAVLFKDRGGDHWTVLFVPVEGLSSLAQAARAKAGGKPAVATAPLPDRRPSPARTGPNGR